MNIIVSFSNGQAVTTSLTIAEGTNNQHKNVLELIRQNVSDLEEFGPLAFQTRKGEPLPQGGFAKSTEYALLNEQQATLLITYMRNNDVVRAFKKQLVKAFYEAMHDRTVPKSLAQALRLAADLEEAKEKAELERDEAIRTKAMIGTKREASAMSRAAKEKARADRLEIDLGVHTNWKQVKAIDWVPVLFDRSKVMYQQLGKYFRRVSSELDLEVIEIEDSQYGMVKAYHVDAISEAYSRIKSDGSILCRYRRQSDAA